MCRPKGSVNATHGNELRFITFPPFVANGCTLVKTFDTTCLSTRQGVPRLVGLLSGQQQDGESWDGEIRMFPDEFGILYWINDSFQIRNLVRLLLSLVHCQIANQKTLSDIIGA